MKIQWLCPLALFAAGITAGWVIPDHHATGLLQEPETEVESEIETTASPLTTLDWLVGSWTNSDESRSAQLSCRYTKNDAFLLLSFGFEREDGDKMSGMQVIAWDPAQQIIRSWTYDSDGGFGEGTWRQSGDHYTIRSRYTLPDGGVASSVKSIKFVDDDTCTIQTINREIDGKMQPDTEPLTIIREKNADTETTGETPDEEENR